MKWIKLGKIFECEAINEDLLTHASNPLAVHLNDDVFRVFFSGRNIQNKSSVGFVDIDIFTKDIKNISKETTFKYGDDNSFYSHGVSIGNMYTVGDRNYILFMGWQQKEGAHWRGDIGRLKLDKKILLSLNPSTEFMVSNGDGESISLSYPWVIYDEGIYKMWYGTAESWNSKNGEMTTVFKYATSIDGYNWKKYGTVIPSELGVCQAFSRPSVIKDAHGYHMWFSYRSGDGTKYRIGYAHSIDGLAWDRKADSGIDVSENGWDSEMICYPFVFEHKGKRYMLYNGNDYGKTGFGLAVMGNDK